MLSSLYEECSGRTSVFIDASEVLARLGIEEQERGEVLVDLSRRGYLQDMSMCGTCALTPHACELIEHLEAEKSDPSRIAEFKMILNPSNCNINVDSDVCGSKQAIEVAGKKWWESIPDVVKSFVLRQ